VDKVGCWGGGGGKHLDPPAGGRGGEVQRLAAESENWGESRVLDSLESGGSMKMPFVDKKTLCRREGEVLQRERGTAIK